MYCNTVLQEHSIVHIKVECLDPESDTVSHNTQDHLHVGTEIKQEKVPPDETPEYAASNIPDQSTEADNHYRSVKTECIYLTEVSSEAYPGNSGNINDNLKSDLYEDHKVKSELNIGPTAVKTETVSGESSQSTDSKVKSDNGKTKSVLDKVYGCDVCGETFSNYITLQEHVAAHNQETSSEDCNKNSPESQTKDLKASTGEKSHSCDVCMKYYATAGGLKLHLLTHMEEKPYSCDMCKKSFSTKYRLKEHMRIYINEKPFVCNVCKRGFSRSQQLKRHFLTHTGEKPYTCDSCAKCFRTAWQLKLHSLTHSNEKAYNCDTCTKSFRTAGQLKMHFLTHTGEKSYTCDLCKKGFKRSDQLKQHYLTHSDERPYSCKVCAKGFKSSASVKLHMLTHTGEKPHSCNLCKKSFTTKQTLKHHLLLHTGENANQCDVCKKSFTKRFGLTRHLLTHTDEKPQS
ncbi:gastrula zinc finger protein XlCGF46.1 [Achroia grisella]|uniref:gastrula zinc finger protein XlCGF46.1 n=1 Tax=Achroia grisella TaxID=688607 RepID=UPI0027D28874|nr:gastrula zinc finger protein XlCGF46.1 [Achroia grisella]